VSSETAFGTRLLAYSARRLAQAVPLVLVVVIINFFLIHAAPGDPVDMLLGGMDADPEFQAQMRRELGLDQPLWVQLWTYVSNMARLDLGYSFRFRQDVGALIMSRLPASLLLMGTSFVISVSFGILLGVVAAYRAGGLLDRLLTGLTLSGYSMPVFWLGQLMLLVFAVGLGWFPIQGMVSLRTTSVGFGRVLDVAHHLALPALTYSVYQLTLIYRLTRVKMRETLSREFVKSARARGLSELRVVFRHAFPNAMLPVVTVMGLHVGHMLAGSVLTETVFAWPGLGRLMYEAIGARDFPLLLGLFTCISVAVIVANVVTDVIYAFIDPRVVYS
jgi:peptide/nickel transport system permease protein